MLIKKREEVTKQGFCKILWKLRHRGSLLLEFIHSGRRGGVERLLSLIGRRAGWALIRGWRLLTCAGKGCVFAITLPCSSNVFVPLVVAVILFDSGVPVVLWHLLVMVSWLSICECFCVAYCVLHPLVFIGVVKLVFVPEYWPPASFSGPFIPSHSAPSLSWRYIRSFVCLFT